MQGHPGVKHVITMLLEDSNSQSPVGLKEKHKFVTE